MNTMRRPVWVVFALVMVAGVALAATEGHPSLDGKTFNVQLLKGDAKTGDADTLSFASGMFDSSACHAFGFGKSSYTAKSDGSKVVFEVHATSTSKDKQVWNGTVDGNTIEGTMKYTDVKGVVTSYRFSSKSPTS